MQLNKELCMNCMETAVEVTHDVGWGWDKSDEEFWSKGRVFVLSTMIVLMI